MHSLEPGAFLLREAGGSWRLAAWLFLRDRPGELAALAGLYADHGANIERFHYNRSKDSHLAYIEGDLADPASAGSLAGKAAGKGWTVQSVNGESRRPAVVDPGGLLKLKLSLEDRPGTLARAAGLMRDCKANVIHMDYDGSAAPGLAEISLAAGSPGDVRLLLEVLRREGCHFHVAYRGDESADIDQIIGLSAVETFLFRLRSILPPDKMSELSEVIDSSDELSQALRDFKNESGQSGESMAASEVFTNILQLAAASVTRTGDNFSLSLTGPCRVSERVRLYMQACPTGANIFLLDLDQGREYLMLDSSYGLYYPDARDWLKNHSMDPSKIKQAFFTHPDADHAGFAAPLQQEFGTEIRMHPGAAGVLESENRAFGASSRLEKLNGYYTMLINRFTGMRRPEKLRPFEHGGGERDGFPIIGRFEFGDVEFEVLESLGGHVPAQVFFFAPQAGLLFSGDYLIDIQSLSGRAKSTLSIARTLMTSTNVDSQIFSREMRMLKKLMLNSNRELGPEKKAKVFPGHGDFYAVEEAGWDKEE